ncbi:MAG: YcxB family protein [Dehalococcoidia bacterium]|nr:YcxB family protein [Dehalococcoidia bacterium]
MDIEFENTMDDILALNTYHFQRSPGARRNRLIFQYVLPGIPALIYLALVFGGGSSELSALPWLLLAMLLFVLGPFSVRRSLKRRVVKMVAEEQGRGAVGGHRLSITRSAVTDKAGSGKTTTNWTDVKKVVLMDNYVFIYIGDTSAHIVPKRAFPDETAWKEFKDTIGRYYQAAIG